MRLKDSKKNYLFYVFVLIFFLTIQCEKAAADSYKSEIEITPAPPEETTTKKSGFFSGIKSFFRGSSSSTTTTTTTTTPAPGLSPALLNHPGITNGKNAQQSNTQQQFNSGPTSHKPTPLVIPSAPLQPLGPRPDTPLSSPFDSNQHKAPQWPQPQVPTTATTTQAFGHQSPPQQHPISPPSSSQPFGGGSFNQQRPNSGVNGFPGFGAYQPPKSQPSGLDLSYGGGMGGRQQPQAAGRPGFGLAPMATPTTSTTTTTTTTPAPSKPVQHPNQPTFDMRGSFDSTHTSTTLRPQTPPLKEDFPALPPPRRPSTGTKEDFPPLPTAKSPSGAFTPSSPIRPSSPTAWNTPQISTPTSPVRPGTTPTTNSGTGGVSFVPHIPPLSTRTTTTVRPGFENTGNSLATDDELINLSETLFSKETSQLNLIQVNPQGKTRSIDSADEAPQPLLEVDPQALEVPTIAKMRLLFNNYELDSTVNEYVTPNERKEENDFVDALMTTSVMRQAMLFLQNKGVVTPDPKTHRDLVKELWFTQYSRGGGKIGSSGFEHVFVSEVKNGTLLGFHNWVYWAEEEKAGRLDYKGYMKQLDLGNKAKIMKLRFTHSGVNKPVNTISIGTTPELEIAMYTVCFMMRPDRTCPVAFGNNRFGIVTYSWRYRGKNLIGSAFMEI